MRHDTSGKTQIWAFDSASEFADAAQGLDHKNCDRHWTGESWSEASERARAGRTDLVPDAERLLEQVQTHIDAPRSTWQRSVGGAYAVIPEVLMGLPDPMRRRQSQSDNRAPLRVYVDLTSSAAVGASELTRRGVACLALAMALGAERPVELYGLAALDRGVVAWRIADGVLDLATACNALVSTGLVRGLGYSWLMEMAKSSGEWLFDFHPGDESSRKKYVEGLRKVLCAGPLDVIIPPAHIYDESIKNPVGFVQRSIDEYRALQEQEAA